MDPRIYRVKSAVNNQPFDGDISVNRATSVPHTTATNHDPDASANASCSVMNRTFTCHRIAAMRSATEKMGRLKKSLLLVPEGVVI